MSIKCYDFFGCKKKETCPYYATGEERNCWEVELHLTPFLEFSSEILGTEDKLNFCKNCLYYEHVQKIND
jgi:hypothetical protein